MKTQPSDNILRLRELTEKLNKEEAENVYKNVVREMKTLVERGKKELDKVESNEKKINCYENMCVKIMNLLKNTKI